MRFLTKSILFAGVSLMALSIYRYDFLYQDPSELITFVLIGSTIMFAGWSYQKHNDAKEDRDEIWKYVDFIEGNGKQMEKWK